MFVKIVTSFVIDRQRETYSSSRIQYFKHTLLSVYIGLFSIAIFDGRVILFDKHTLNELNCQRRFPKHILVYYYSAISRLYPIRGYILDCFDILPDTATSQYYDFILSHIRSGSSSAV